MREAPVPIEIDRQTYASLYGPTVGDRIRLGDTNLLVEIEEDHTSYGDEVLGGCGKTLRDGMLATSRADMDSHLDVLVSNVLVIDPVLGIFKGNIGVKDGKVVGIGRAGNPDVADDIDLIIGSTTGLIPGEGLIATPGGVDAHVHLTSPAILPVALSAGITTFVGMDSGGVWDVGLNPEYNTWRLLEAWRAVPLNLALLARGGSAAAEPLERSLRAGASGFKIHEDFGAYPAVIDACLAVAEQADVAVAMHTDSLNESGLLRDTVAAIAGRTVHAYHVEGSGGGHIPNILEIVFEPNVITSSTTPTLPFSVNVVEELFPMIMTAHLQNPLLDSDVEVSRARVRRSTIEAESVLHEMGAISIIASDSTGMGRIGEVVRRTWQLAHWMKTHDGRSGHDTPTDNERILRYIAKYTINPAITHGLSELVGSLEPGKLADIALWEPAYFGTKPEMVIKGGFVAWAVTGDGSGSTHLGQPRAYRARFGSLGDAPSALAIIFASQWALDEGLADRLPGRRQLQPVSRTRGLSRADMVRNTACPRVTVPPGGGPVLVDGRPVRLEPVSEVPLGQRFHVA